jgi:hypothetical protein
MKSPTKKGNRKKKLPKQGSQGKNTWLKILLAASVIVAIILLTVKPNFDDGINEYSGKPSEIKFRKDGELTFFKKESNQIIKTIDIEIADDEYERAQGLMYRYKMSDSVGMLFIMEREEPQSFWMRNTYISLDIIYLNNELEIVKIQKYTQPLTDDPIPSFAKSKYVVEVTGGFCDLNSINEGDYIKYERHDNRQKV